MKRTLAIILALLMVFCLFAACGEKKAAESGSNASTGTQTTTPTGGGNTTTAPTGSGATSAGTGAAGTGGATEITTNELNYSWNELRTMNLHPSDKTMHYAFDSPLQGLTQMGHQSDHGCSMGLLYFEMLLQWDSLNNCIAPCLAKSYEWVDDTTLRLELEQGIKSIAGDPFTASDVLWSYDYQAHCGKLDSYYNIFDLENSKAIGDYTVEFKLKSTYPFLPLDMCAPYFAVGVEKSARDIAFKNGEWDQIALDWNPSYGTGPYKLLECDEISYMKAERRDDYWSFAPYYKYWEATSVTDTNTRVFAVEAGDAMATEYITFSTGTAYKDSDEITIWADATPGGCYNLFMNSAVEVLQNKNVRQAIALGIDYQSLSDVVFEGFADPSDSVMAPGASDHYFPPDGVEDYIRYDPDLAKQKLKEAGFADGVSLELRVRSNDAPSVKIAEMLNNMLENVGIHLTLNPIEGGTYTQTVKAGEYELACGLGANPNPKTNIDKVYSGISYAATTGWCNTLWYDGDQQYLTDLCDRCYFTVNDAERMEAWKEMHELSREYVPFIMLCYQKTLTMTNSDIVGLQRGSYGGIDYAWLYEADYITG